MTKAQAIHKFWSSFGVTAYDEYAVPDDAKMPYITYNVATDSLENSVLMHASIWDYSTSWKWISEKVEEISRFLNEHGYAKYTIDNGYVWIVAGTPFAQRMADSDTTKRIYMNIQAEFLTAY